MGKGRVVSKDELLRFLEESDEDVRVCGGRVYDRNGRCIMRCGSPSSVQECYDKVVERMLSVAEAVSGYSREDIMSNSREDVLPCVRQVVMYFLYVRYGFSLSLSGRAVGRDHSTVVYAAKCVREAMENPHRNRRIAELLCRFETALV